MHDQSKRRLGWGLQWHMGATCLFFFSFLPLPRPPLCCLESRDEASPLEWINKFAYTSHLPRQNRIPVAGPSAVLIRSLPVTRLHTEPISTIPAPYRRKGKTSNRPTGSELLVTDKPARVPRYYFALITCHNQVLETQAGSGNGGRATLSHASPISTYPLMATRVLYKGRARKVIARASRRLATTLQAHVK